MKKTMGDFWRDETGMGTVEIFCKSLHAKIISAKKGCKAFICGKNSFCMSFGVEYAKYAK